MVDQPSKPSDESTKAQPLPLNGPANSTKTKRLVIKRRPTISQPQESQTKSEVEAVEKPNGDCIGKRESTQNTATLTRSENIQAGTSSNKSVKAPGTEQTLTSRDNTNTSELSVQTSLPPDLDVPPTRPSQDEYRHTSSHSSVKTYLERMDSTSHDESLLAEMASLSTSSLLYDKESTWPPSVPTSSCSIEQELVGTEGGQVDSLLYSKDDVDLMLEMEEFI